MSTTLPALEQPFEWLKKLAQLGPAPFHLGHFISLYRLCQLINTRKFLQTYASHATSISN